MSGPSPVRCSCVGDDDHGYPRIPGFADDEHVCRREKHVHGDPHGLAEAPLLLRRTSKRQRH